MNSKSPYLSLCIICGDGGAVTLPRLLKSVLDRSGGPMVDEIVICWNGKGELTDGQYPLPTAGEVPIKVIRQTWPGRFDVARNESFKYATGEWVLWLDSVTGDTPIAVREKGSPFFEYIEIQDLVPECYRNKKHVGRYVLKRLEVLTHKGWQSLNYVKQHWVKKPVHQIIDDGMVCVTRDHSLFSGGKEITGEAAVEGVELDHEVSAHGEALVSMPLDLAEVWGFFAAEGSAYWSSGSAQAPGRSFWTLSNTNKSLLERYTKILATTYARPFEVVVSSEKSNQATCWRIQTSRCAELTDFYRTRFYSAEGRKKVPREILNATLEVQAAFLRGYEIGDGSVRRESAEGKPLQQFSTNSPLLAAGLVYLYRLQGRHFRVSRQREDKLNITHCIEFVGRWRQSAFTVEMRDEMRKLRKNGETFVSIAERYEADTSYVRQMILGIANEPSENMVARRSQGVRQNRVNAEFEGWVFDISTDAGTFVGGVGDFVLHNTDDVVSDAGKSTPDDLPAVERCEADYGIAPPPKDAPLPPTLKQWLQGLPWDVNCVLAPYDYTIDENGYVVIRQKMKRIVRRSAGFIWWSPDQSGIHEVLYPLGNVAEKSAETMGVLIRHYPAESNVDRAKRNREIVFEMSKVPTESTVQTARHQYDLANSLLTIGEIEKADQAIRAAIANAQSPLDTYVYRLARASLCAMRGRHEEALGEAFAAVGTLPDMADAYFVATEAFYLLGKWDSCVAFYELGRSKKPSLLSKDQPLYHFVQPRVQAAMAWGNLQEPEQGLVLAREALALYPKNELAREGVSRLRAAQEKKKAVAAYLDLAEFFVDKGQSGLARELLSVVPVPLRGVEAMPRYRALKVRWGAMPWGQDPIDVHGYVEESLGCVVETAEQVGTQVKAIRRPATYDVAFYCPHAVELWWPRNLDDKALGGSESSVAYLARELAKLDVRVTTYTPCAKSTVESVIQGVIERDLSTFDPSNHHEVLVACRAPWMARRGDLSKDVRLWVWHQDNGYGNSWTWSPEVDARIALNLHVSHWAMAGLLRECYAEKDVHGAHVVLGNGVPESCAQDWPKERALKVIYASDPGRGLEALLDAWPAVRASLSTAELHVYVSFQVSFMLAQQQPGLPQLGKFRALEARLVRMVKDASSGLFFHGWAPQAEVIAAMKTSRIYCYPGGPMPEGYGVSLAQARASGCRVMCPYAGALPEVLRDDGYTSWLGPKGVSPSPHSATQLASSIVNELTLWHLAKEPLDPSHFWSQVARRFYTELEKAVGNGH